MEVILVRHTSVGVPRGTCYGWTDVPLADTFEEEAAATKANLQQYAPIDSVFSSPLTRARRLAEFCTPPTTAIQFDERLKEMNMGQWEMKIYDEIDDPYFDQWMNDYMHLPTPGGEGFPGQYQRVSQFLDELKTLPYNRVAVFAHGGVLVCAGLYGGLFQADTAWSQLVPYGGLERIVI